MDYQITKVGYGFFVEKYTEIYRSNRTVINGIINQLIWIEIVRDEIDYYIYYNFQEERYMFLTIIA